MTIDITDEFMRQALPHIRPMTVLLLKRGPSFDAASPVVWEHGRRNFLLRATGALAVVCPISDGGEYTGVGIFDCDADETQRLIEGDPGVQAGIFTYEIHASRSFPGDAIPGDPIIPRMPA